ncbi:hypothetical protein [Salinactinospora qingdaonensis]|uniref:Uncharacterized protein n=1 Tax=Salinactinospora qingdaonensis TaxID=702744 RepID=A0ABP7G8I9_9ACTN
MPFDEYKLSGLDIQTIAYAEDLLTRACMREVGLDWQVLTPMSHDPAPLSRRRYGVLDPEMARHYGYHLPPPSEEMAARDRVWQQREELPKNQEQAVYGTDDQEGCWDQAREQLHADVVDPGEPSLYEFESEAFEAATQTGEVTAVFDEWSACMREEGFDYADPLSAVGDSVWTRADQASQREVAAATADVACKDRTDLVQVWSKVESRLQEEAIEEHPARFAAFAEAKEAQIQAARQAIAELD